MQVTGWNYIPRSQVRWRLETPGLEIMGIQVVVELGASRLYMYMKKSQ
jgi:hypothetical protein